MKFITNIAALAFACVLAFSIASCDDTKSYAELLTEEDHYVNAFLANNDVVLELPQDNNFICGPTAPFYRLDEDGFLYMRVLDPGTKDGGHYVENNEQVYFRYTRYALNAYTERLVNGVYVGTLPDGEGNNLTLNPCWFRYNNYNLQPSNTWGSGIQYPLMYLPIDCRVQLVVKSTMGPADEIAYVIPYLWELTYQARQ